MADYQLNGKPVEVLGQPMTVRLQGQYKGEMFSAPLEVWVMSLVAVLSEEHKTKFFTMLKSVQASGEYQKIERARVVADILMPPLI